MPPSCAGKSHVLLDESFLSALRAGHVERFVEAVLEMKSLW